MTIPDVEEVADEYFGAERLQRIGALVDLAHKSADRNFPRQQQFGDVPAGLALGAAGR